MTTIITWGSCPVCGDCGEPVAKIEHVIDGWTGLPMHKTTCSDCGEHYAFVGWNCPNCKLNYKQEVDVCVAP
jgi:hypothetical protein